MTFEEAKSLLEKKNQLQVLTYYEELSSDEKESLLKQVGELDWKLLDKITNGKERKKDVVEKEIAPLPALNLDAIKDRESEYRAAGLKALSEGKCAAVLLAGGMGTRLGFDGPKGTLPIGEERELYLFEQLVENLKGVVSQAGRSIPFYIMTSEKNDASTRTFFEEHDYFGYSREDVHFFIQEMAAAVDYKGKLLMEEKGRLATSPNGNGGWFSSLAKAGLLEDLHKRGVEWINIFGVDNPLQKMCDPVFLGATILSGCQSGSKVVRKNDPHEKMGVVCRENGQPSVIEYYELSEEMANAKDSNGILTYGFGVILNYLFRVDRLEEIMGNDLPVHIVEKKIPYIDENGCLIKPEKENGYKFETLVVDMVRLMDDTVPFEVVREEEFAPIKNLHGVDSLDSSRELMKKAGIRL